MLKHMAPSSAGGRVNRSQQPLNVSNLGPPPTKLIANGLSSLNNTTTPSISSSTHLIKKRDHRTGAREALTSLGLLCLVSLLLALLSLIFLLKISPGTREPKLHLLFINNAPEDYTIVYDVTLALCALSLSLNLCCLLVCAIQFLFAVKLVRAPATSGRGNKYLQKSSVSRVCAVGGFFISIPIFLTGIILYTFTQFQSTPAIITSVLIGVGIFFCGAAMVHNVFVWQKEKTICVRQSNSSTAGINMSAISTITPPAQFLSHNSSAANNLIGLTTNNNSTANNTLLHLNHSHANGTSNHHHTPLTHTTQSVTPLSPNHSHVSFNHNSSWMMRTATPPTPKVSQTLGRDASGSVSPGMMDMSTNSPHELSTLV